MGLKHPHIDPIEKWYDMDFSFENKKTNETGDGVADNILKWVYIDRWQGDNIIMFMMEFVECFV